VPAFLALQAQDKGILSGSMNKLSVDPRRTLLTLEVLKGSSASCCVVVDTTSKKVLSLARQCDAGDPHFPLRS
jgi:hypothetical protein